MKKNIFMMLVMTFMLLLATNVYAGPLNAGNYNLSEEGKLPVPEFEITDGIPKEIESSFAKTKTFSGKAPKDSEITITIYEVSPEQEIPIDDEEAVVLLDEKNSYTLTVGALGIFTQTVDLHVGENYVRIQANLGELESVKSTIIKCKDEDILRDLEHQGIALPGQALFNTKAQDLDMTNFIKVK